MPISHFFWLPYAVPLGCVWFVLVLVQGMVQALGASEELAVRLATRVADRTQALDTANQAQTRFLAAASHDLRPPVPLQALFNAIAAHEQAAAQAKGLRLRFKATDQVVMSDPLLLEQVLRNLVGNALRHTTRGGVLVAARAGAQGLRLQVWDSGRGLRARGPAQLRSQAGWKDTFSAIRISKMPALTTLRCICGFNLETAVHPRRR